MEEQEYEFENPFIEQEDVVVENANLEETPVNSRYKFDTVTRLRLRITENLLREKVERRFRFLPWPVRRVNYMQKIDQITDVKIPFIFDVPLNMVEVQRAIRCMKDVVGELAVKTVKELNPNITDVEILDLAFNVEARKDDAA